jgi:hypothetical protein
MANRGASLGRGLIAALLLILLAGTIALLVNPSIITGSPEPSIPGTTSTSTPTESRSTSIENPPPDDPTPDDPTPDDPTPDDPTPDDPTPDDPTPDDPTPDDPTPDGPDQRPNFTLFAIPQCEVLPHRSPSGADILTLHVAVRNSGPGEWDRNRLVPWRMSSDTGLGSGGNTTLSVGSGFTAMSVDLRASDYGRLHRFTVVADPGNSIEERGESDNTLAITVSVPSGRFNGPDPEPIPCFIG